MDVSDDMQRQAKAIADPSRFRLFRHITEADHPVGVAELTELLGFNHNAIRQHLAVLTEAGLVAETTERRTVRGRPRKQYTARPDALAAFRSVTGSYERLARLLLEVISSGRDPYDVGFEAGSRAGLHEADRRGRTDGAEPDESTAIDHALLRLSDSLADEGFEPGAADGDGIELLHCPFAHVAAHDPGIVCELHRGLLNGHFANDGAADQAKLMVELTPEDPHRAGCRVTLRPHSTTGGDGNQPPTLG